MKKLFSLAPWKLSVSYVLAIAVLTAGVGCRVYSALELSADNSSALVARDEIFWTPLQLQLALERLTEETALFSLGQADRAGLNERLDLVRSKAGILQEAATRATSVSTTPEFRDVAQQLPVFLERAKEQVSSPTPASLRQLRQGADELMGSLTSLAASARAAGLAAQTGREAALDANRSRLFAVLMAGWVLLWVLGLQALLFWQRVALRHESGDTEIAGLRRALDVARKTEAARNTFLAKVSHEINSPLQAILTNVQLMESRLEENGNLSKLVARLKASVGHLRGQVHDLLDVAEINSGKMRVKFGEVDVAALMEEAVGVQQTAAENKGLSLKLQTSGLRLVRSDGRRLNQIVTNLVTNAIRYTEAGTILVSAAIEPLDADHSTLQLTVRDTGIGFASEVLENLYQPFMPVVKHRAGSGLGLAIVKGLVDQLNGTIELKTQPAAGSEFLIRIPVSALSAGNSRQSTDTDAAVPALDCPEDEFVAAKAIRETLQSENLEEARHLLFVEDDPDIQDTMSEMLEHLGYVCHPASSMQEGLSGLTERKYSAIVVDMELGDGTGLDVARAAKSTVNRNVPLVVCTAYSDLLDQPGMDIFDARFRKPVDANALRDMLARLVSQRGAA
jgi:signal transduction histidine kinase